MLRADGNVFACHADRELAVQHGEVGSSAAVLKAGYSLDCLMLRYAGVDWRDPAFGGCNAGCAPPLLIFSATPPPRTILPLRHRSATSPTASCDWAAVHILPGSFFVK